MLKFKKGNILESEENIICHQVNIYGVMGGGLALQIANLYPKVEKEYKKYCDDNLNLYDVLKGESYTVKVNDNQEIANCFTQLPNFATDYQAIIECFTTLLMICKKSNKTICIPYKYGCGIANGDWNIVSKIFKELSEKYEVDIFVYEYDEKKDSIDLWFENQLKRKYGNNHRK